MQSVENGRIGAVIPAYKETGPQIDRTTWSIMEQDYRKWEAVMVFDGEKPPFMRFAKNVKVFENEHKGAPATRNFGVEQLGEVEFIYIAEADAPLLIPDVFSILVKALKDNPDCDYAYGRVLWDDREGRQWIYYSRPFSGTYLCSRPFIPMAALIRAKAWIPQDESLPRLQDYDMWLNMLEQNKSKGVLVPRVLIYNPYGADRMSGGKDCGKIEADAMKIVREKHKRICPRW